MKDIFNRQVIFVFSPQPWNYLQISKHHYTRTLSRQNKVFYIAPPTDGLKFSYTLDKIQEGLEVLNYTLPTPWFLRFKFPTFYKLILRHYLSRLLQKIPKAAVVFDFGCYQQFDSLDFVDAQYKIFFPVDDFGTLIPFDRGADVLLSVSKNIQAKFPKGKCHFINHGLSEEFSRKASQYNFRWSARETIKVGCSGNLFIQYLDTTVIMQLVKSNPKIDFYFFGLYDVDLSVEWQRQWSYFLKSSPNVKLHGVLSAADLCEVYEDIDVFLLCYRPDYVNYHGENSHKVLEYLSTGKVLVSSYLSIYEKTELFRMAPIDQNESLLSLFAEVILNMDKYNSELNMHKRINFALENTYQKQLERIRRLLNDE